MIKKFFFQGAKRWIRIGKSKAKRITKESTGKAEGEMKKKNYGLRSYLAHDPRKYRAAQKIVKNEFGANLVVRRITHPDTSKIEKFVYSAYDEKTANCIVKVEVATARKNITKGGEQKAIRKVVSELEKYRGKEDKHKLKELKMKKKYADEKKKRGGMIGSGQSKPPKKAQSGSGVPGANSIAAKERAAIENKKKPIEAKQAPVDAKFVNPSESWEPVMDRGIPAWDAYFADLWNSKEAAATGYIQFCGATFDLREFKKVLNGEDVVVAWEKTVEVQKHEVLLIVHNG